MRGLVLSVINWLLLDPCWISVFPQKTRVVDLRLVIFMTFRIYRLLYHMQNFFSIQISYLYTHIFKCLYEISLDQTLGTLTKKISVFFSYNFSGSPKTNYRKLGKIYSYARNKIREKILTK